MQYFRRLFLLLLCIINYCFYGVRSRKTFARAFTWAQAEAKRGMDQVNDRAKEKKIVCRVGEGGHTIIVLNGMY